MGRARGGAAHDWSRGSLNHHLSWGSQRRTRFSTNRKAVLAGGQHGPRQRRAGSGVGVGTTICDTQAGVPSA